MVILLCTIASTTSPWCYAVNVVRHTGMRPRSSGWAIIVSFALAAVSQSACTAESSVSLCVDIGVEVYVNFGSAEDDYVKHIDSSSRVPWIGVPVS